MTTDVSPTRPPGSGDHAGAEPPAVPRRRRLPDVALGGVLLVVIYGVGLVGVEGFGGGQTVRAVLLLGSFLGIAAAGQTLVVVLGGIDLSIPFVVGAANVAVAQLYGHQVPFPLAVLAVVAVAGVFGVVNAVVSVTSDVHPLIVTLGTGTALLGAISVWTQGLPSGGAPPGLAAFVAIGSSTGPLPVAPVVLLWAAIGVAVVVLLRGSVLGRRLYALGSSPRAAELALVRRGPVWAAVFALSSVLAAVAGVLLLGFTGSAFAGVGQPYLFLTVGAVVLGGTLVTGGRGGYLGTVIGTLTITLLTIVLTGFGLNSSIQQVVMGIVFVLIVAVHGRDGHVRDRL